MDIYRIIEERLEQELSCSAHNLEHVRRVYSLCRLLAADQPEVDRDILKMAALLHDIARVKEDEDNSGGTDHAVLGAAMAGEILEPLGVSTARIAAVQHCIAAHRYRNQNKPRTIEARILFDADKLDVIGAIGIARSFVLAGQYHEPIYSGIPLAEYIGSNLVGGVATGRVKDISRHTADLEFALKLKHIPQRLYTEKAKRLAAARVRFMADFFARLEKEIAGEL